MGLFRELKCAAIAASSPEFFGEVVAAVVALRVAGAITDEDACASIDLQDLLRKAGYSELIVFWAGQWQECACHYGFALGGGSSSSSPAPPAVWGSWFPLGGKINGGPSAFSRQPSITDVFVWGMDDQLWQRSFVGGQGWLGWHRVDENNSADAAFTLLSAPFADSMAPDHVQVFAYGTKGGSDDPQVYYKFWTASGGWGAWTPLGGQIVGRPTARSRRPEICDVFVRGMNDQLWQRSYVDGQGWLGWHQVDESNPADAAFTLLSEPTADTMGPDHVQVFAYGTKGGGDDPQVYSKFWTASGGWSGWSALGGKIIGAPAARSRQSGICDVFVHGMNDQLWQRSYVDGQGWLGWHQVDESNPADAAFTLLSDPTVDTMAPNHVQVFAFGSKGADDDPELYQKFWA
jgi:hypothetical protein